MLLGDLCFGTRKLLFGHAEFLDVFQFGKRTCLSFQRLCGFKINLKKTKIPERFEGCGTARDQSVLVTKVLIQDRGTTVAENGSQYFKGTSIVGQNAGSVETDCDMVLLDRSRLRTVADGSLFGFGRPMITLNGVPF